MARETGSANSADRKLEADREFCHACGSVTTWEPARGAQSLRCEVCGDRFPCRSVKCGHEDCEEARFYLAGLDD